MLKQCVKDVQLHRCFAARYYITGNADSIDISGDVYPSPTVAFEALLEQVSALHVKKPVIVFLDSPDEDLIALIS